MSRYLLFVLFLPYIHLTNANIPRYECEKGGIIGSYCILLNVELTSDTKNFVIIPHQAVSKISEIDFWFSKMEILTGDICEQLSYVRQFKANGLGLIDLDKDAFEMCERLTHVDLSENSLTKVPLGVFRSNRDLREVRLNNNKLTQIDMNVFRGAPKLEKVQLSQNLIQMVAVREMPVMKHLGVIDLENNQLLNIDVESLLDNCPNLRYIWLHHNRFQCDRKETIQEYLRSQDILFEELSDDCIVGPESLNEKTYKTKDDLLTSISSYSSGDCGNFKFAAGYVMGGERRSKKKFPWVAALYINGMYACTANFISRTRAVTAAHCFQSKPEPDDVSLLLFSNKSIKVKNIQLHSNFLRVPEYDIAYVDTEPVNEEKFVPVCLTDELKPLQGHQGTVVSYAPVSKNNPKHQLNSAMLTVIVNQYCTSVAENVPTHSFCVGQGYDGSYLCAGDSGSGFLMFLQNEKQINSDNRYFLRGIVSTGNIDPNGECSFQDNVILTDVTKFLTFVVS